MQFAVNIDGLNSEVSSGQNVCRSKVVVWSVVQCSDVHRKCRFSPYRAVNTLRLGYKNQSANAV